jgi:hypothetical protein
MHDRYGLITHTIQPAISAWFLDQLNHDWYLSFSNTTPIGKQKMIYVGLSTTKLPPSKIASIAAAQPGAHWYVYGEPNVHKHVDGSIEDLKYYYDEIKLADPTAILMSPSMLNWDFTCIGCGGYTSGQAWMTELVTTYQSLYGTLPPWDVWSMDIYPIDWSNFPNTGVQPFTQEFIPETQITRYRDYIDSLPGRSGDPIVITELGIHWGYEQALFNEPGCSHAKPGGNYRADVMIEYFDRAFTWLEQNAVSKNIERWMTFITYSPLTACTIDPYTGISLFDGPNIGANLTEVGQWYKTRSGQ